MAEPLPHSPIRFSPLVNLPAGRIVGFSADFNGAGSHAMRTACRAATQWPDGFVLTVNVPAARWRDPSTGLGVLAALGKSGLPAEQLELTIPDVVPARDLHITRSLVDELRRFGVRIALTGCGVLATAAMPSFEVDKIELAAHLVDRIGRDPDSDHMAARMLDLAADHGVIAAAAGIDTGQQFDALREMGCTEGFGALFGVPVATHEVAGLLRIPGLAEPAISVA